MAICGFNCDVPVMNESIDPMIYGTNHIFNCGYEILKISRLLYAIAKFAFITARILASFDFSHIRTRISTYDSFHVSFVH